MTALSWRLRPLCTEVRRGVWAAVPVTVPLLCGPAIIVLSDRPAPYFSWVTLHDAPRSWGVLFGGPAAFATGFWQGGRERRHGTGELLGSTPVSPLRRAAAAATPAVLWPVAGYALTAVFVLGRVAASEQTPFGLPFLSLLVADAVAVGAFGLLGFVAGRLIPSLVAGQLLAAAGWAVMAAVGDEDLSLLPWERADALRWLSPANQHWAPWDAPVWWSGPASSVWYAAAALAALAAYAGRRRLALVSLALAAAGGSLLVGTGEGLWRTDPRTTALDCSGGTPEVCVIRLHRPYLAKVTDAVSGVTARLREIPDAPERLVEVPAERPGVPAAGARLPGRNEAALVSPSLDFGDSPGAYAWEAAHAASVYGCAKTPEKYETRVPRKYSEAVTAWLTPGPDGPAGGSSRSVLARIHAMPAPERTGWLGDYFAAVRDCRPERIPPL